MKLIADSGSTKTDWVVLDMKGNVVVACKTQGINPFHQEEDLITQILMKELCPQLRWKNAKGEVSSFVEQEILEVYFYGSGVTEAMRGKMTRILQRIFPQATVDAQGDLMGAAYALLGDKKGIACILGTGANSCLYDGKNIVKNIPPLGYILGDEGSGAYIGKRFLNGIFKGGLSEELREKYLSYSGLTYETIIQKVYREPLANRYLASCVPFIVEQMSGNHRAELSVLIYDCFQEFYAKNISKYLTEIEPSQCPIGFVGSVAFYLQDILKEVMEAHHLCISSIIRTPLEGLIQYHTNR